MDRHIIASIAYLLAKFGAKVTVLEKSSPTSGASVRLVGGLSSLPFWIKLKAVCFAFNSWK